MSAREKSAEWCSWSDIFSTDQVTYFCHSLSKALKFQPLVPVRISSRPRLRSWWTCLVRFSRNLELKNSTSLLFAKHLWPWLRLQAKTTNLRIALSNQSVLAHSQRRSPSWNSWPIKFKHLQTCSRFPRCWDFFTLYLDPFLFVRKLSRRLWNSSLLKMWPAWSHR